MKRILSFVAVGVVACLSLIAAIDWNSGTIENLALGSTVTVSSNQAEAQNIVDGNDGTGWQAAAATHEYTHDWVLINLGEVKTFTDMEIVWEASHCKQYSVYVSTEAIPYTSAQTEAETPVAYNVISADWLSSHTAAITGGNDSEANYTENLTFTEAQTGQYILIYADEYNNFGSQYGMRIFDVKLANIEGRDEVSGLNIACEGNAVAGGDAVTVTVTPVSKAGETLGYDVITDLQLTCDNSAVTITEAETGKYNVSATTYGEYTLTATAKSGEVTLAATYTLNVAFNWDDVENIATDKSIQGRVKADTEDPNPPANAVDGSLETYYQYNGEWGGGDGWLLVDLGDVYNVEAIGAYYTGEGAAGKCMFGYAMDATAIENKIATDGTDYVWNDALGVNEGWTFTPILDRVYNTVNTYTYSTPVIARYIVIKDADNPGGKPCVNNIYVKGTLREAPKADRIDITLEKGGVVIGETNTVTASVVDQYGDPMTDVAPTINVTGATYADGTITCNQEGMVTVTASVEGVAPVEAKFYVANEDNYCLAGATITASEGAADDVAPVTDGGKGIAEWGIDFVLAPAEAAGAHEHWILVKLAKPYDFDLIAALWEGACPADYDIYLGETEETLTLYYTQRDKEGLQNYSDRFSGKEMKNIQYIKVVTTKNATDYGIKLHDLKAYGTSNVASVPTSVEVSASDNDIATETEVTLSATVLDQFDAEMPDAVVTYSCDDSKATIEGDKFTASAVGNYTVTATCGDATADIVIRVVANALEKVTTLTAFPCTITKDSEPVEANVFDNQEVQFTTIPATLKIDFEKAHTFSLIEFRWEAAAPSSYTVTAEYADGSTAVVLSVEDRAFVGGFNPIDKIINNAAGTTPEDIMSRVIANSNLTDVKSLTLDITDRDHDYPVRLLGINAYSREIMTSVGSVSVDENMPVDVYNLQDIKIRENVKAQNALDGLPRGIYIVGGKKIIR